MVVGALTASWLGRHALMQVSTQVAKTVVSRAQLSGHANHALHVRQIDLGPLLPTTTARSRTSNKLPRVQCLN